MLASPTAPAAPSYPARRHTQSSRRVLIVDDDHAVLLVLRRYMERRGWTVLGAGGALEALALLDALDEPVDVAVVDLRLPDSCGGTLCRQIVERHPEMTGRILMASGDASAAEAALARESMSCRVMAKPFELVAFLEALEMTAAA